MFLQVIIVLLLIAFLIFLFYQLVLEFSEDFAQSAKSDNFLLDIIKSFNTAMKNMISYIGQGKEVISDPLSQVDADLLAEGKKLLRNFDELKDSLAGIMDGVDEVFNYPLLAKLMATISPWGEKDFGKLPGGYTYVILEDSEHPFQVNQLISETAQKIVAGKTGQKEKAEALFVWFLATIIYGSKKRPGHKAGYRTATEVFSDREGVCGEMAVLYVVMARSVGLKANFVVVEVDFKGEKVSHACAALKLAEKETLVDLSYSTFDIKHQKYIICSDQEAVKVFQQQRSMKP